MGSEILVELHSANNHQMGDFCQAQYNQAGDLHCHQSGYVSGMNRIRELRESRGLSGAALAELSGISPQQINRLEHGKRRIHQDTLEVLARALQCRPEEIIAKPSLTPVVGIVGAGNGIIPIDDLPKYKMEPERFAHAAEEAGDFKARGPDPADPYEYVSSPPDARPTTVALRVEGDSMLPLMRSGWVLYYSTHAQNPDDLIGQICVCALESGERVVKVLRRGSKLGHYTLESWNASPIEDVRLEWVAKVDFFGQG